MRVAKLENSETLFRRSHGKGLLINYRFVLVGWAISCSSTRRGIRVV